MDTLKIGSYLRQLRKEKGITQEQLAELLSVSNRTVSRWETGRNLPDFDVLLELSKYYDVSMEEILAGERKDTYDIPEETMDRVAEYTNAAQAQVIRRLHYLFIAGAVGILIHLALEFRTYDSHLLDFISGMGLGLGWGIVIVGAVFTSPMGKRIQKWKINLLYKHKR